MRPQSRILAAATAIAIVCSFSALAVAGDSAGPVRTALAELQAWLGSGKNAEAWEKYLDLTTLRAQLAKGNEADPKALANVQQKLESGAKGLELPRFAKLRTALSNWSAQLPILQAPNLSDAVRDAPASFRPITEADVSASKTALESAATKLGKYLSGSNGAAWKKYLGWQDLQDQLKSQEPDVNVLAAVYEKFTADEVGLQLPVFANVADRLERYQHDLVGHSDQLREQYDQHLKDLATSLQTFSETPSNENAIAVGRILGWLENMRQAPALVAALRQRLAQPNLRVVASARLIGAGIAQKLKEETPVRDYILGTDITGSGQMDADVSVELVPNDNQAVLDTMLRGLVHSRTVGYNGPATIYSTGATAIAGRKRIMLDADGFNSLPATAAANTNTLVTGIGAGRIVQRVAWKRVGQQKPQAERIAADHAATRVRRRMDEQIAEQLGDAQQQYLEKVRDPLLRRRAFPSTNFSTTSELLSLVGVAATNSQIGAATPPPEMTDQNDLAVWVHESAINNLAASLLSGVTLKEEELQERVEELRGSLPESLAVEQDRDPWRITLAKEQPIIVHFGEEALTITVRGDSYISGDDGREWEAMDVTADYKIAIDEPDENGIHGIKLTRIGELTIDKPGFDPEKDRRSPKQLALRVKLRKRFDKLFEPEIKYDGVILPGRWREAGILDTKQLGMAGGWIALAWLESGVPAPPEEDKETDGQPPEKPAQPQQQTDRVTRAPAN